MAKIEPQTALITGGARRIGRAIAEALAQGGWRIAVHFHTDEDEAAAAVAALQAAGGTAQAFRADLADAGETQALVEQAGALGPVTCLVNNAALFEHDDIATLTPESWDAHLNVNLRAPVLLAQGFAKALPEGENGAIVNIADQRVWKLTPDFFSYTVAKSGLWTVTRTLAQALSPRIRVNAVGPGPTLANRHQSAADFAAQQQATLLGHAISPTEIAAAVTFILDSPGLTGQMIAIDGGQHLTWRTADTDEFHG